MAVGFLFLIAEGVGFGQLRQQAEEEERAARRTAARLARRHARRPLDRARGPHRRAGAPSRWRSITGTIAGIFTGRYGRVTRAGRAPRETDVDSGRPRRAPAGGLGSRGPERRPGRDGRGCREPLPVRPARRARLDPRPDRAQRDQLRRRRSAPGTPAARPPGGSRARRAAGPGRIGRERDLRAAAVLLAGLLGAPGPPAPGGRPSG